MLPVYNDSLNEVFTYADVNLCELTNHDTVYLECTIRRTGATVFVEGDDLDDAVDRALREIEDQVWTLDQIMSDYGLSIDDLRAMVDFTPKTDAPPFVPPIVQQPITLVASAQPFVAADDDGRIYLALEVLPPPDYNKKSEDVRRWNDDLDWD